MLIYSRSTVIVLLIIPVVILGLIFSPFFLPTQILFDKTWAGLFPVAKADITQSSVTVVTQYNLFQNNFRFYSPIDFFNLTDVWPPGDYDLPINSKISISSFPIHQGDIIRLKTSLTANAEIPVGAVRFKLQFKTLGAGCLANESWYDVGEAGSTAAWRGFDIPGLEDDAWMIGVPIMPDSDINGGYNEFGTTDWNPVVIPSGQDIEYDWVIQNNLAVSGASYCFRIVQVDSTDNRIALPGYNRYIEIETPPEYAVIETNTIDYSTGGSFSLTNPDNSQFFLEAPENYLNTSMDFKIYSFAKDEIISVIGSPTGRQAIGDYIYQIQSQKDNFFYHSFNQPITISISYSDSDVAGFNEDTLEIRRWNGQEWVILPATIDTTNNLIAAPTSALSYFEIFGEEEEAVCGNGVVEMGEQCDGSDLAGQTCVSQGFTGGTLSCNTNCTFNTSNCSSGGGGGGGGGGKIPSGTKVVIEGKAYPRSQVTLLKDGKIVTTKKADSSADFNFKITKITPGTYTFSLWAVDNAERKSVTISFTTNVIKNTTTTLSGIFLPPTIELSKIQLEKGETLDIFGQTAPESEVSIFIDFSKIAKKTEAETDGTWLYSFDTTDLKKDSHNARAKAESPQGLLSTFSQTLVFYIGKKMPGVIKKPDVDNDEKVNLVDFSILLYNWGVPKNPAADFNNDGKVNLVDFSIMLYHWTG